jgi:flagellar biosynthesis protein FliR
MGAIAGQALTDLVIGMGSPALIVLARAFGLASTAPAWGTPILGWRIRLGLSVLLTLALWPVVAQGIAPPSDGMTFGRWFVIELAVGALLGMTMALVIAGARQAGELVGAQAGLSAACLFDPESGSEMTPLGHLYGWLGLATFLVLDGPVRLVGALIESYRAIPAGGFALSQETAELFFSRVGQALSLVLSAAAPAALALILAGLALGLLTRAAPSIASMTLALPVRSAIGLILVLLGLATLAATLSITWQNWPFLSNLAPV